METKKCSICKQEKPLFEMVKNKTKKGGYDNNCKKCGAKRIKKWKRNNPEKAKEVNKNYYWKHRENHLEKHKEYYQGNKEKIKERVNEYYQENKDAAKGRIKKYRKTDKGKLVHNNSSSKRRAKTNNSIDSNLLLQLKEDTQFCPLCGIKMNDIYQDSAQYNLDHIIPLNINGTHTIDNIRYICRQCNITRPRDGSDLLIM